MERCFGSESSGTALSDQWQKMTTSFTLGEGQLIQFEVLSRSPGGCFLVDDAVLYRAK